MFPYDRRMPIGQRIQAWRLSQKRSLESVSNAAGIDPEHLERIESDLVDLSTATLEALASALRIPPSWLFEFPASFDCLFQDGDEQNAPASTCVDPVTDRILSGSRMDRSLYVLLTALMQTGDPKLLRAAEMSLRSLLKQSRQATVPWQQRPPGHFEPPSD